MRDLFQREKNITKCYNGLKKCPYFVVLNYKNVNIKIVSCLVNVIIHIFPAKEEGRKKTSHNLIGLFERFTVWVLCF